MRLRVDLAAARRGRTHRYRQQKYRYFFQIAGELYRVLASREIFFQSASLHARHRRDNAGATDFIVAFFCQQALPRSNIRFAADFRSSQQQK
jgi:hypothetical protein